jgi:AraC-like DNA-binding protein
MTDPGPLGASFLAFVHRCQATIGELPPLASGNLRELWLVLGRLPDPTSEPERLVVTAMVADVLTRLRTGKRITRVPAWGELRLLFDDPSPDAIRRRLAAFRLLEVRGPRRGRPGSPNLVGQTLRVLAECYGDPLESLSHVAKRLGVTPGHLGRVLRRRTGRPFRSHLHEIRTRRAAKLLLDGLAVKQVSTSVGYPSVSEFDRQFRAVFGMTPSEYRALRMRGASASHAEDLEEAIAIAN